MTIEEMEEYLENYRHIMSTEMDKVFPMFKSDVSHLAQAYRKNEAYVYSKSSYIEMLQEALQEAIDYEKEQDEPQLSEDILKWHEEIKEVQIKIFDVAVDKVGSDVYFI